MGSPGAAPAATREGQGPDANSGPCHFWGGRASAQGARTDRVPERESAPAAGHSCGQPGAPVGPDQRLLLRGLCGRAQARERSESAEEATASVRFPVAKSTGSILSSLVLRQVSACVESVLRGPSALLRPIACAECGRAAHSTQPRGVTGVVRRKNSSFNADAYRYSGLPARAAPSRAQGGSAKPQRVGPAGASVRSPAASRVEPRRSHRASRASAAHAR
jgi:hypothetical protein